MARVRMPLPDGFMALVPDGLAPPELYLSSEWATDGPDPDPTGDVGRVLDMVLVGPRPLPPHEDDDAR